MITVPLGILGGLIAQWIVLGLQGSLWDFDGLGVIAGMGGSMVAACIAWPIARRTFDNA